MIFCFKFLGVRTSFNSKSKPSTIPRTKDNPTSEHNFGSRHDWCGFPLRSSRWPMSSFRHLDFSSLGNDCGIWSNKQLNLQTRLLHLHLNPTLIHLKFNSHPSECQPFLNQIAPHLQDKSKERNVAQIAATLNHKLQFPEIWLQPVIPYSASSQTLHPKL